LIVLVPEAETAVSRLRDELDPVARLGVPAHISVLVPFVPAAEIDEDVVARTAELFRSVPAFQHNLVRTAWFGEEVLWLAPDASEEFRSLTERVWTAFPAYPPYEGQFDDVVPHLTVADHGPVAAMRAAEQAIQGHLPIRAVARAITLMVEQPSGDWEAAMSFGLDDPGVADATV
jgi:2'-5' RNA ligase